MHHLSEVECKKHQEKRCTTTPRTVESQSCETREEKVCDRITERIPKPVDKPHCRNEEKKVCRVEKKTQPKQVKKYAYTQVSFHTARHWVFTTYR